MADITRQMPTRHAQYEGYAATPQCVCVGVCVCVCVCVWVGGCVGVGNITCAQRLIEGGITSNTDHN